jgi:hypothetical protein
MTAVAIITGIIALACLAGGIGLAIIGFWQATIPLVPLALIFSYMAFRDIQRLRNNPTDSGPS